MDITTVLGERRKITEKFEDGSALCPWCRYPLNTLKDPPVCENPGCDANVWHTPATLTTARLATDARVTETESRARNFRLAGERIERDRLAEDQSPARIDGGSQRARRLLEVSLSSRRTP